MQAQVGDQLVKQGQCTGLAEVVGIVIEVSNEDGSPPWLVKFYEDGHEELVTPPSDTYWVRGHAVPHQEHSVRGTQG